MAIKTQVVTVHIEKIARAVSCQLRSAIMLQPLNSTRILHRESSCLCVPLLRMPTHFITLPSPRHRHLKKYSRIGSNQTPPKLVTMSLCD